MKKKRAEIKEQHYKFAVFLQFDSSVVLLISLLAFFISVKNYYYYLSNCCIPVSHVAHIKVKSHKITNHQAKLKLTQDKKMK